MKIIDRMQKAIARRKGEIILTRDFNQFGSRSSVSKAIRALVEKGILYPIGKGVYAKAEEFRPGKVGPRNPNLESLAGEALERLGVSFISGQLERDYNNGSTQIPAGVNFEVFNKRISRKLKLGGTVVKYENRLR